MTARPRRRSIPARCAFASPACAREFHVDATAPAGNGERVEGEVQPAIRGAARGEARVLHAERAQRPREAAAIAGQLVARDAQGRAVERKGRQGAGFGDAAYAGGPKPDCAICAGGRRPGRFEAFDLQPGEIGVRPRSRSRGPRPRRTPPSPRGRWKPRSALAILKLSHVVRLSLPGMDLSFDVHARIARPVAEVFAAVAEPRKLSAYFTTGGASGPLREGSTVTWKFGDIPGEYPVAGDEARAGRADRVRLGDQQRRLRHPGRDDLRARRAAAARSCASPSPAGKPT